MSKANKQCYSGIGGQAVLEGIMMKNKERYAVAVRQPDGSIVVDVEEYHGVQHGNKIKEFPFIRGIFNFVDSLVLGSRALTYSSKFYEEEEKPSASTGMMNRIFKEKAESVMMGFTVALSIVMAVAIFMVLPYFLSEAFESFIRSRVLLALVEGAIRLLIFVLYIVLISKMEDIKRVYMYHGAEHKCINCIEKGRPLTVDRVMSFSRQHKRCGTSFMLFVMFVSIVLFIFIRVDNPIWRVIVRILLVPVIAGISYEIIRFAGSNDNNPLVRMISAPGMMLQKLTTKEPTEDMVEVAIAAIEAVFDWKAYLKDTFGITVDEEEEAGGLEESAIEENIEATETTESTEATVESETEVETETSVDDEAETAEEETVEENDTEITEEESLNEKDQEETATEEDTDSPEETASTVDIENS